MFEREQQQRPNFKPKTIHFILNGHPQKLFTHIFQKPLSINDIQILCDKHWEKGRFKTIRFFSLEGVQIMEEDLAYVRNGSRIYVSRGQQFDGDRNFGEYQLLKQLGEGGFGKVWLARSSIDDSLAAIKILKLQKITGAHDIDMFFREVETLKTLSHPNIVKIINCYALTSMQLIVVMEYLAGGELLAYLKEKTAFNEPIARKIFSQVVEAVLHCHRQGIIHRDLKLQNVLLEDKDELKIKVADFGISGLADTFNPDVDVGTLRYMAPEVLSRKQKSNTAAVDVWACGVMLYCMVFGRLPFAQNTSSATSHAIISGKYILPKNLISLDCQDLITQLLTVDPKQRPTMSDISNHPWVLGKTQAPIYDHIIENFTEIIKSQLNSRKEGRKIGQDKKKLPSLQKRPEKQKQQGIQQLRYIKGSRDRLLKSESKWRGASPRYMNNIKCRQQDQKGIRRKKSFITALWK